MEEGDGDSSGEEQEELAEEREEWGKQFTRTTKDKTQPVPSVTWTLEDPEKMPKSCIREAVQGRMGTKYPAEIINIPPGTSIDSLRTMANHLRPKVKGMDPEARQDGEQDAVRQPRRPQLPRDKRV